jgi:hypothetical protein
MDFSTAALSESDLHTSLFRAQLAARQQAAVNYWRNDWLRGHALLLLLLLPKWQLGIICELLTSCVVVRCWF